MWVVEAQKPGINVGNSDCSQNTQDGMGWEYPGYNELPLRLTALLAILTSSEASWEREQRLFSWQGKQYQWRTWTWQALRGRQGNGLPLSSWKWHDPAPLVVGIIDRVWTIKNHLEIWWWWQIINAIRNSHDGGALGTNGHGYTLTIMIITSVIAIIAIEILMIMMAGHGGPMATDHDGTFLQRLLPPAHPSRYSQSSFRSLPAPPFF